MNDARARAKGLILQWHDKRSPKPADRPRLARNIDLFFDTIEQRNSWRECLTVLLGDREAATFFADGSGWRGRPTGKGLAVSSVLPGWNFGWSSLLKDKESHAILSWLGHYAHQYVHRSHVAKVLMAAWERDGLLLHPFGDVLVHRYDDRASSRTERAIFAETEGAIAAQWGQPAVACSRYRSKWTRRNTLEPAIHQAIFHFLRGQSLLAADFELEALVAFDCVLHSLQYMDWSWAPGNAKQVRADLCRALGFGPRDVDLAEHVYFLRNHFVAHAGGWRWWDAGELVDETLVKQAGNLASRAIRRAADIEPLHRRIEPEPTDWAAWLLNHFPIVWAAVWFRDP